MLARTYPIRSTRTLRALLLMGGIAMTPVYASAQTTATPLAPPNQSGGPHPLPGTPRPVPKMPDTTEVVGAPSTGPTAAGAHDNRPIIGNLKGLVLIDDIKKMKKKGVSGSGVMPQDLPMLDDQVIKDRLAAYLGKPVTQGTLKEINRVVINWYREKKYPFVDVAAPAGQDVTNGVIQIVVTESRFSGKVSARGNKWFSSDFLVSQVRLKPGDRINIGKLEDDKNWINQNPFRLVNIVANRGTDPATTDLTVDTVQEKIPLRAYVGYNNSGQLALGHDRWEFGFTWGNALWLDDQFSYQLSTSDDFWHSREQFFGKEDRPAFVGHTISYEIATGWRDKITIYGSYLESSPLLGPFLGFAGTDASAGIRYTTKLPSTRKFDEKVSAGWEFKTSNNNLEFGGFEVSNITTEVAQFFVEYDATNRDDYGQTDLTNTFVFSPGGMTDGNNDRLYALQTCGAINCGGAPHANYVYDHVVLTRVTGLPQGQPTANALGWFGGVTSITRLVAQISNSNLIPSEQMGIGGVDTVRGYDDRIANGSEGVFMSEELRTPAFSLANLLLHTTSPWNDLTQLGVFYDYGSVFDNNTAPGAPNSIELESVGLGFHLLSGPDQNVRIDVDYGWQLRKLPGLSDHSQFGHVAVVIAN
jgi:hemolysin activation/secretion protein